MGDMRSAFLPSEIVTAFLMAQLENIVKIKRRRMSLWNLNYNGLIESSKRKGIQLPIISDKSENNADMFYLICPSIDFSAKLIDTLNTENITAVFHYLSLHKSKFYIDKHDGREFVNSDSYSEFLIRLPMFYDLKEEAVYRISNIIKEF